MVVDITSDSFVNLIIKTQVKLIGLWNRVSFRFVLRSLTNTVGHLGILGIYINFTYCSIHTASYFS